MINIMVDFDQVDFDTSCYLKRRFSDPEDQERGIQPFLLKSIHDFYTKFSSNWNSEAVKVMEFGGGPAVYSLISASPNVSEITFADYSAANLRAIEKWRDSDPAAHDWEPYVLHVISKLEGRLENIQQLVQERMQEMRSKIKTLSRCDIFKHSLDLPPTQRLFDVVSTHFCLEAVVTESMEEYRKSVKRLSGIIKPGGYMHSLASLEESYWLNGQDQYNHLYLTREDVISAYQAAGLDIVHTAFCSIPEKSQGIFNDCKGVLYVAARKQETN